MTHLDNLGSYYTNPVYGRSFPDPFVLKFKGRYYAYCTGDADGGRIFPMLASDDLVDWDELPGAMQRLESDAPFYWAPEVTYHNGRFYLYYSVGNEVNMELRVAVSDRPDGGFVDAGRKLTDQQFAIDAHVFRDIDRRWYMFYATDFLDHSHIGTGTVVDEMVDPFTLKGEPRPVTRARYDWQVYDPVRKEKGGVRWHTVEGPFVMRRKATFFEMFSGGNWQNISYGVSYAITRDLHSTEEWAQYSDGDKTLPILRTIPQKVIGPGHNCAVLGPNDRELYCVYHSWTDAGRVLAIDRMGFASSNRIFILGPTYEPQPGPYKSRPVPEPEVLSGEWQTENAAFTCGRGASELAFYDLGPSARLNVCLRALDAESGNFGVRLRQSGTEIFSFELRPSEGAVCADWPGSGGCRMIELPADFDFTAYHELQIDVDIQAVTVRMDEVEAYVDAALPANPNEFTLFSAGGSCEFSALRATGGFEELFENPDVVQRGWDTWANHGSLIVADGTCRLEGSGEKNASIGKVVPEGDFELCINLRIENIERDGGAVFLSCGPNFTFTKTDVLAMSCDGEDLPLPAEYNESEFRQFRFVKTGDELSVSIENVYLGTVVGGERHYIEIAARTAAVEIEMVRFTLI